MNTETFSNAKVFPSICCHIQLQYPIWCLVTPFYQLWSMEPVPNAEIHVTKDTKYRTDSCCSTVV